MQPKCTLCEKRQNLLTIRCLDTLAIEVTLGGMHEPIYIVNLYNRLHGCIREGEAVRNVMNSATFMHKRTIIGGEFNLHHGD